MDDPIAFDHEQLIHLDSGPYHWVSLKAFTITASRSDKDLIAAMIRHPQYRDNYLRRRSRRPELAQSARALPARPHFRRQLHPPQLNDRPALATAMGRACQQDRICHRPNRIGPAGVPGADKQCRVRTSQPGSRCPTRLGRGCRSYQWLSRARRHQPTRTRHDTGRCRRRLTSDSSPISAHADHTTCGLLLCRGRPGSPGARSGSDSVWVCGVWAVWESPAEFVRT